MIRRIMLVLLLGGVLTACGGTTAQPTATAAIPTATAVPEASHLQQALSYAPSTATFVSFTDWALIKQYEGVTDLTSSSPEDAKSQFLLSTQKDQAAASAFALNHFGDHAATWGWDTTDLVWEATIESDGPPLYVLRFPDDFDFAPVLAHFDERGFTRSDHQATPIYSHAMDLKADWLRSTDFAILNTAVLTDEHIFVLSNSLDTVQQTLDIYRNPDQAAASIADVQATIDQLGETAAAIISPGGALCSRLTFDEMTRNLRDADPAQIEKLKQQLGASNLHPYTVFGVSYRYENNVPVGRFVLHYPNAADAQADLEPRRVAVTEGSSLVSNQPYSETVFTLDSATVGDSSIVLNVRPRDDLPSLLFRMVLQLDLAFATCP